VPSFSTWSLDLTSKCIIVGYPLSPYCYTNYGISWQIPWILFLAHHYL